MHKRRSEVWKFYTTINRNCAKCNFCNLQYSYKGRSTTNLTRHLERKHQFSLTDEHDAIVAGDPVSTTSSKLSYKPMRRKVSTKVFKGMQSKFSNFRRKPLPSHSAQLDNQLLNMIVSEYQPFSLVEDKEFRNFVQMLNPNYVLPSRKTLSNVILPQLYIRVQEIVKDLLLSSTYIAITTDNWTSISNESYQAIIAHLLDQENKLVSVLLGCYCLEGSYTAQNLSDQIKEILCEWEILEKVCAVVTDDIANITAAVHILEMQHVSCFAHSLNLTIQKALQQIKVTHNKVISIVEQIDSPAPKLKQDINTRWNFTYNMFDRILKMKDPLESTFTVANSNSTLSACDFEVISWCCKILKPFKDVIEELSAEATVTVSKVLLFNKMLKTHMTNIKSQLITVETSEVHKFCEVIISELIRRFKNIEDNSIYSESTFLDPRFKKYGFSEESIYNKTYQKILQDIITLISEKDKNIEYENESTELQNEEDDNIWNNFDQEIVTIRIDCKSTTENVQEYQSTPTEYMQDQEGDNIWSNFDEEVVTIKTDYKPTTEATIEIEKYIQEPLLPRNQDPLKWWEDRKCIYKNLYLLVRSRLCIPATAVPSDQILSKTGQTLADCRSRLSPSKVEKIIFLNHNLKFLDTLL